MTQHSDNHEREEWEDLAPNLAKRERTNPFQVPDGYFDSLPTRIQERYLAEEPTNRGWIGQVLRPVVLAPALAAVVAVILVFQFFPGTSGPIESDAIANLTTEEIEAYLLSANDLMLEDDLMAGLSSEELDEIAPLPELDDADLEELMLDGDLDLSDVFEDL